MLKLKMSRAIFIKLQFSFTFSINRASKKRARCPYFRTGCALTWMMMADLPADCQSGTPLLTICTGGLRLKPPCLPFFYPMTDTVPAVASTLSISPVRITSVAYGTFDTSGSAYSLATTAPCDNAEPTSVTSAPSRQ